MSRNLTEGGERPLRVLIDELEERMDFAGAGLEPVDDTDPDRCREWLKALSATLNTAIWRSADAIEAAGRRFNQKALSVSATSPPS